MNLMRPWLTTEYVCSLANISCAMNHITGHQDELQEILGNMATNELQELIISDCIELEMPPRLQAFPNLTRVVIYNSSISLWEMDAALTADHHAKLASLSIIETNMSAVPPALLHSNLPPTLSNLAFSGTNLTTLPDNAHEYWTMVNLLCLEISPGVTEVPSTFRLLPQIAQISLVGNSISVLPDDWFTGDTFMIIFLDLNGNPLTSLPSAFSPDHFPLINIKGSLIEYLPDAWMDIPEIAPTISAGGTRLCAHLAANESVFAAENSIVPFMDEFQTYMVQSIKVRCPSDSIGMRWFGNPPGTLVNFAW
ncbi:hypothetical protein Poli38472_013487 [Pythium oligandrum]|uniref:Uncharacterized protein n=1 Tax=Pythium oligandrum TaxID=41045 RepID=A0A8K1C877_PYTOL|nr:hypothetical protein Poli38472_013487 [Pythium oligandrum]|eukprot:TMW58013.1 hypothetical protein Poli38472_013487 [Pythium oligandrum]